MKRRNFLSVVLALVLVLTMLFTLVACNKNKNKGNDENGYTGGDTLVVGYSRFSNKFSPYFSKTSYDQDVASMTQVSLFASDRGGNIIYNGIEGETVNYNGTDYTYYGLSNLSVTMPTATDTNVYYDITIRDNVKFSDGSALTIDDVIFSMYVLCDPSYDGSSTLYAQPIKGLTEYRTGVSSTIYDKYAAIADAIAEAGQGNLSTATGVTQALTDAYWNTAIKAGGAKFAQEIVDYVISSYGKDAYASYMGKYTAADITSNDGLAVAFGMKMWGFGSWVSEYVANATGSLGKVGDAYKGLYIVDNAAEEEDVMFAIGTDNYVAAGKATTGLVYVSASDSDGNPTEVTAFSGDRYNRVYTGALKGADGTTYTCTGDDYPTAADYWTTIDVCYDSDYVDADTTESAGTSLFDFAKEAFISSEGPKDPAAGGVISSISGITKTGANSVRVTMTKFDAVSVYQLAISVTPLAYYGDASKYDYANNKFGLTKGDLTSVRAKTTTPMGAGPYKFVSYTNGVVTFVKNDNYYLGAPKITNVLFKETDDADKIAGITAGTFDISDPSIDNTAIAAIKSANSSDSLNGATITTDLVDFLGYGYIGINAATVKVGTDSASSASTASKNLRKAFATIFASQREVAISSYYGDRATVINYPMSNTSWAAPQANDAGYAIAYSKDVNGNAIYAADDNQATIDSKAKAAALGFFKAAGYTLNADETAVTAAPTGASLSYEVLIPGDGKGDHPSFAILTAAKSLLASIGIELIVTDLSNSADLWDAIEAGTQEIWCAAWGATVDPDMYQVYYSSNIVGGGGTESNHYHIQDDTLDELIMEARTTSNKTTRKNYYKQCLDIVLDWGVEIPVYQRKDCIVFSTARVNVATVTSDITPFYGWMAEIEKLEMN